MRSIFRVGVILKNTARARQLRRDATDAERLLWSTLREFKQLGFHFRRQAPIGPYIADFACHRSKLIVELDGSQHNEKREKERDAVRTAFLESRGYFVVRVWNNEVFRNGSGICDYILALAKERSPRPKFATQISTSPQGGGET